MGCPFSWKGYVGMWFATLVGCRIDIIKAQATEKRGNDILGMGYPELVELARGRAEELGAERPDLHVVFAEDVDQWKANDPFTEIWVVMPWDVDADAFHEVSDWLDSRCRFNE